MYYFYNQKKMDSFPFPHPPARNAGGSHSSLGGGQLPDWVLGDWHCHGCTVRAGRISRELGVPCSTPLWVLTSANMFSG